MKNNHILRLESDIKRILSDVIQNELKKDVGLLTITDTDLTNDYSYLTVYYTVLNARDKKKAREGLLKQADGRKVLDNLKGYPMDKFSMYRDGHME